MTSENSWGYPSSRDLEVLRASYAGGPATLRRMHPKDGGATELERRFGIGYRIQPLPNFTWHEDPNAHRAGDARRGGNELRTALWWAQVDQELADGWPEVPDRDQLPGLTSSYQAFVKVER